MLKDMINHVAAATGLDKNTARTAVGVVFNAAERQGAPFADTLFSKLPGARALSATVGAEIGAATGEIARLIERTPGGRRHVATGMIRELHHQGLGHQTIGSLLPAIGSFVADVYDLQDFAHLGDLLGAGEAQSELAAAKAA